MISTLERRAGCAVGGRDGTATLATSMRPREKDEGEDEDAAGAAARRCEPRAAAAAGAAVAAPGARAPSIVFIARRRWNSKEAGGRV